MPLLGYRLPGVAPVPWSKRGRSPALISLSAVKLVLMVAFGETMLGIGECAHPGGGL